MVCLVMFLVSSVLIDARCQTSKRRCKDLGVIALNVVFEDSYTSARLDYQFERPDKLLNARLEVWDRPMRLFSTSLTKNKGGTIAWVPTKETPQTPLALWIKVSDPAHPNDTDRSRRLIGYTGPVNGGVVPRLLPDALIVEEGTGTTTVTLKGTGFNEHNTVILLMEEEAPGIWASREYITASLVDLGHVSIQIAEGYLSKPTRLRLEAVRPGDVSLMPVGSQTNGGSSYTTIYVMGHDRPILSKIEPSAVSRSDQTQLTVRILGSGFTPESQILASFESDMIHDVSVLKPLFVSEHELQIAIPPDLAKRTNVDYERLRLWVRNGDHEHVSDSQPITLIESGEDTWKRPSIAAVSPYPVPLIDYRSEGRLLKIYGDNFSNGEVVLVENGELGGTGELKTEFISSQELSAWVPRELWRGHRLSFKLTAQSASGECAIDTWQNW
jgi:hypothetical protein